MTEKFLQVNNLKTYFSTPEGLVKSVDGVTFHISHGETLALVGESGCGKTVTSLSLIGLLPDSAIVESDSILLDGVDISQFNPDEYRRLRGKKISMIFQEPMTSLNPVLLIERQIGEVFRTHFPELNSEQVRQRSIEMLDKVGIPSPEARLRVYPHQLSGGLRQRVMIAIALASNPALVIADEPTTALDVTLQAQILDLLKQLQKEIGMSLMLITHDFGVVSQIADRVAVMYAGKIVEQGHTEELFKDPWHPYTRLLILSIPGIKVKRGGRLETIAGNVPSPLKFPPGCRFHTRCPYVMDICRVEEPPVVQQNPREVACFLKVK